MGQEQELGLAVWPVGRNKTKPLPQPTNVRWSPFTWAIKRAINVPQPQKHPAKKLWKQCKNQIGIKSVGLQNAVNKTPLNAENKALGTNQLPVLRPGAGIQSQGCLSGPCSGRCCGSLCLLIAPSLMCSAQRETL